MAPPKLLHTIQVDVGDLAIVELRGLLHIVSRHTVQRRRDCLGDLRLARTDTRQLNEIVSGCLSRSTSRREH
jgi:hypothetical protein